MPCGPACHWVSAATTPDARRPPAPCTRAGSGAGGNVTTLRSQSGFVLQGGCNKPPAACLPKYPHVLPPPLPVSLGVRPAVLQSLPTPPDIPGSSPARPLAPKTPAVLLP